jgi:hypothetical protein
VSTLVAGTPRAISQSVSAGHPNAQTGVAFPPPSTLDPPVGLSKGGAPEANAGRAASAACLIPPSQQSQHEKLPAPPLSSTLPRQFLLLPLWLIRPAARIIPLRIPPSRRQAKARTFLPLVDRFSAPADSAQSSRRRSRSRILLVPPGDGVQSRQALLVLQ